jgi:mannitol/fructose-specific phosphotransferase system IIA component (Ntr-type)
MLFLVVLDVEQVAKLASSMQLAIFVLINVAVIVMRESQIEAYDPGFRSPLYPWMQLAGVIFPLMLVAEMGWLSVLFTLGVIVAGVGWYQYYARARIEREGAIFHVFARLGRRRFAGLDRELRDLMKEKGLRAEDPFDEVVARAQVIDAANRVGLRQIIDDASVLLQDRVAVDVAHLVEAFTRGVEAGGTPVSRGAALLHTRLPELDSSEVVLVRCRGEVQVDVGDDAMRRQAAEVPVHAIFFVVSPESDPGRHLRILAQLAGRVENGGFMEEWLANRDEQELKETLLRDDRFLALKLRTGTKSEAMIGHALRELGMPEGSLVALIRRYGVTMVPRGRTVLREGDRLTIIGEPAGLQKLDEEYGDGG